MNRASKLHIRVRKNGVEKVSLTFPVAAVQLVAELIPSDVLTRVLEKKPDLQAHLRALGENGTTAPQDIFNLEEPGREIRVWLA